MPYAVCTAAAGAAAAAALPAGRNRSSDVAGVMVSGSGEVLPAAAARLHVDERLYGKAVAVVKESVQVLLAEITTVCACGWK